MNISEIEQDSFIRKLKALGTLQDGLSGLYLTEPYYPGWLKEYTVRWHSGGIYMQGDRGSWMRIYTLQTIKDKLKVIIVKR